MSLLAAAGGLPALLVASLGPELACSLLWDSSRLRSGLSGVSRRGGRSLESLSVGATSLCLRGTAWHSGIGPETARNHGEPGARDDGTRRPLVVWVLGGLPRALRQRRPPSLRRSEGFRGALLQCRLASRCSGPPRSGVGVSPRPNSLCAGS